MEEKIKSITLYLDETARTIEAEENERWTKTIKASACKEVEVIDRELSLWGKIKRRIESRVFPWGCFVYRSWTPLWTTLYGTFHNLLAVANSSETYKQYPPQELDIIASHRELSPTDCYGSTDVYHRGQLISQVRWHLWIRDGYITLEVECPLALYDLLSQHVQATV